MTKLTKGEPRPTGYRRAILAWAELHNVGWTHNTQSAAIENVRVNLSRRNVGMPEKFLNRADIITALEKLRCQTVPNVRKISGVQGRWRRKDRVADAGDHRLRQR